MLEVDLLILNGNIATMDKNNPKAEAVAIRCRKIIAVGKSKEIKDKYSSNKVIDLQGKFMCPGFNDAHSHLLDISAKFSDVRLANVKSPKEVIERIKERVEKSPEGKWIFGERWDETTWEEKRYLTLEELDAIAPKNPCFIRRVCGHLAAVNSLALKELEISVDDPDLDVNPETKKPLGILTFKLMRRISNSEKLKKTQEELNEAVKVASDFANSLGVTSVTDNLSIKCVKAYIKGKKKKELTVRVNMNIPRDKYPNYLETKFETGFGDDVLRLGGVKIFTDGSLGARTAKLSEPYYDDPTVKGISYIDEDEFKETIKLAIENDWQTATHAIGDVAINMIITTFEEINNPELVKSGRHRIEHAEYLLDDHIKRVNKLGLVLSMQPNFPGRWGKAGQLYEIRLGPERYKMLNRFREILDSGAKVCFGSDNMPMNPLFGIWSVAAHPIDKIRITAEEAIYHYTLGAAYGSFEEDIKGSIEPGKIADLVVLDKDIITLDPEKIKDAKVVMTIFGGKLVYQR